MVGWKGKRWILWIFISLLLSINIKEDRWIDEWRGGGWGCGEWSGGGRESLHWLHDWYKKKSPTTFPISPSNQLSEQIWCKWWLMTVNLLLVFVCWREERKQRWMLVGGQCYIPILLNVLRLMMVMMMMRMRMLMRKKMVSGHLRSWDASGWAGAGAWCWPLGGAAGSGVAGPCGTQAGCVG